MACAALNFCLKCHVQLISCSYHFVFLQDSTELTISHFVTRSNPAHGPKPTRPTAKYKLQTRCNLWLAYRSS